MTSAVLKKLQSDHDAFKSKKSIVILEDDDVLNRNYDRILNSKYDITFFNDLASLKKYFELLGDSNHPELVICDIHLPDGFLNEFLTENKDLIFSKKIPIVVVSLIDDLEMFNQLFDMGVTDFLLKSFSSNELVAKIDKAISLRKNHYKKHADQIDLFRLEKEIMKTYPDLTKVEQNIISTLIFAKNFQLRRDKLITEVWDESMVGSNSLAVHLTKLRKKVAPNLLIEPVTSGVLGLEIVGRFNA